MNGLSLSTMWAKDRYRHMEVFVRDARRLGFKQVELHNTLTPEGLEQLRHSNDVAISSVHAPCPEKPVPKSLAGCNLSLTSLNVDVRHEAIDRTLSSIELASEFGARAVILHLGEVERCLPLANRLRQLYEQGLRQSEEFKENRKQLFIERAWKVAPHLDAAKASLEEILSFASAKGILIGLENRVHYHEIPSLEEMEALLAAFDKKPVGYWHDVGHAEVQERLGFTSHRDWLSRLGSRMIGVHLHDIRGIQDHLAPGTGDLAWGFLAEHIPQYAIRVCELGNWNRWEDLEAVKPFLHDQDIWVIEMEN